MPVRDGERVSIDAKNSDAIDLDLLKRAQQQGGDSAFGELMERHTARLYRLAFSLMGNAADVDDVLQETFLGALKGVRSFREKSSVKTWFTRILVNQIARHRRYWRVRRSERPLSADGEAVLSGALVPARADGTEVQMDVAAMLQTLSPEHRMIVTLREMDGLSYEEISQTLDVPVGTVESRLFRARQELRQRLKSYLVK
jgi:RNA polymerase sigma-70 factor (ECF subfamily)